MAGMRKYYAYHGNTLAVMPSEARERPSDDVGELPLFTVYDKDEAIDPSADDPREKSSPYVHQLNHERQWSHASEAVLRMLKDEPSVG